LIITGGRRKGPRTLHEVDGKRLYVRRSAVQAYKAANLRPYTPGDKLAPNPQTPETAKLALAGIARKVAERKAVR
jgi:hypothetical protein